MPIKLGSQGIKIPYAKAYVGDGLVYGTGQPSYTELDYVMSTGSQYINTGLQMGGGFKVKCKVQLVDFNSTYATIIGSHEASSPYHNNFVRFRVSGGYTWGVGERTATYTMSEFSDLEIEASTISSGQYLKINDTNVIASQSTSVVPSNNRLCIFGRYNGSDYAQFSKIKLYYMQIYNSSNELVGDYIPVINENNVVCLYDKVTQQYLYNLSNTPLIPSETSTMSKLDWIESTGTQYINTGLTSAQINKVIALGINTFGWTYNGKTYGSSLFGARVSTTNSCFQYGSGAGNDFVGNGTQQLSITKNTKTNTVSVVYSKTNYAINCLTYLASGNLSVTISTPLDVYVFAMNNNGALSNGTWKGIDFEFYDSNGDLMLMLIPAKRKSDNAIGLYDLVSGNFYFNAGTGDWGVPASANQRSANLKSNSLLKNGESTKAKEKENPLPDEIAELVEVTKEENESGESIQRSDLNEVFKQSV